jgi:hypothetical protein
MLKIAIFEKSVSAVLPIFVFAGIGLSPVSAYASTIGLPDVSNPGVGSGRAGDMLMLADMEFPPASAKMTSLPATGNPGNGYGRPEYVPVNPGMGHGRPDHVPPVNPPIDTPAFDKGLANIPPFTMPASVPSDTLPGNNFGQTAVIPVPAAVWLFGSGLLGLVGMARRKKA